jgi:hypothetical protein
LVLEVFLYKVDNINSAQAFTEIPDASRAGEESGVIGKPETFLLND